MLGGARKCQIERFETPAQQAKYVLEQTGGSLKLDRKFSLRFYFGSNSVRPPSASWSTFPASLPAAAVIPAPSSSSSFATPLVPHHHAHNVDYFAIERARARQHAMRNDSSQRQWPPSFETAGGEYDLDSMTGWYRHEGTRFMYDPDADLYLDLNEKNWFRRRSGHITAASHDGAFEKADMSTLSSSALSKMALLNGVGRDDPSLAPVQSRSRAEASSAIVFTRAVSPDQDEEVHPGPRLERSKSQSVAEGGGIDVDALFDEARASSSEKRSLGRAPQDSDAAGTPVLSTSLRVPSSSSTLSSSSSSNTVIKTTDTQMKRNNALIQQWTQRQRDVTSQDLTSSCETGGGGTPREEDLHRMACSYPVAPSLRYKGKPITALSKKDSTTWLCWLCIRKFNDEAALAKHVTLSDLHRTNATAAAGRTVSAGLAEEVDSAAAVGATLPGDEAGSSTSSNAVVIKPGDVFSVVGGSDRAGLQPGSNTTSVALSSSSSTSSAVDRAEARRTMYGQKKRRAGGGESRDTAYGSHYRAHSRGGRHDVASFPPSKKRRHSQQGRRSAPVVVRASTKIPMDTRASFGAKLMRMMGWNPGEALGNSGNGIVVPVDAIDGMGGRLSRRGVERLGLGHPNADARTDTSTLSGILAAQRKKRRRERR